MYPSSGFSSVVRAQVQFSGQRLEYDWVVKFKTQSLSLKFDHKVNSFPQSHKVYGINHQFTEKHR